MGRPLGRPIHIEEETVAKDWIDEQYGENADWFRQRRVEDLERELAGAEARDDKTYAKNVRAELAALGHGQKPAEKRPRTAAKRETRA
jgi:hypothetical protein